VEIDRRLVPGEEPAAAPGQLMDWLRQRVPAELAYSCSEPWLSMPALGARGSEDLVRRLGAAIDAVAGPHVVEVVPYGTDASTLSAAGIPSVVFGPGDIAQAHTRDEWVDLAEVERGSEVLYRLALDKN
jgi:acetylornithine deacetylase